MPKIQIQIPNSNMKQRIFTTLAVKNSIIIVFGYFILLKHRFCNYKILLFGQTEEDGQLGDYISTRANVLQCFLLYTL